MPSDGNNRSLPPRPSELEVSLFGPGYGECVVLHLGDNKWFVIDSCIDSDTRAPVCLDYLTDIGVDPESNVLRIVATHWHDDHVRGLAKLVRDCRGATFVCSDALREPELLTLVCAYTGGSSASGSGIDELKGVIEALSANQTSDRGPQFAIANRLLWSGAVRRGSSALPAALTALSPSDYSCCIGKVKLAELLPKAGPVRRVPDLTPNHAAVVLWATVGDTNVLLGSDLEKSAHPQAGWTCIVSSPMRPQTKASVFKIPHHGAESADDPRVWMDMLDANPISTLTPWHKGDKTLPVHNDIQRICSHTSRGFATCSATLRAPPRRQSAVEKAMNQVARNRHVVLGQTGHVRVRVPLHGDDRQPRVELFNGAVPLQRLLA